MPKVAKGRRKRAYKPKTRTGCLTCKARRVKCDETKPSCLRCTTTRRVCDGYPHVDCADILVLSVSRLALPTDPSSDIHPCTLSRRSFTFFVQRTSPQLAGLFGSAFWERFVLQAAHHEPAIRHAVTAIGSLHESKTFGRDVEMAFALKQYNLAIRSLLAPLSPGQQRGFDVCLISCILFTCFENMQGHHVVAESHIRSGSKLLQGIVYDQQRDPLHNQKSAWTRQVDGYIPLESLAAILAVLDKEAAVIIRNYRSSTYDSRLTAPMNGDAHFEFSTIEEARGIFEYSMYSFASSDLSRPSCDTQSSTEILQGHLDYFITLITKFSTAMRIFMDTNGSSLSPGEKASAAALQLHVLNSYVSVYVEYMPPACQTHEKVLLPRMKEMVSLCEEVIPFASGGTGCANQPTSFCLDIGYVIPLYTVASQCPDMATRRRAIDLLRSTPRQEGLWNSLVVAKAAERILGIEESTGERLVPCTPVLKSPGPRTVLQLDSMGVRLQYVKQRQDDAVPIIVVEELVTW